MLLTLDLHPQPKWKWSEREAIPSTKKIQILEELHVWKAMRPNGVSNWILKECSSQLAKLKHNIISTILLEGRVPKGWKWADIPIYKVSSKNDSLNYGPVSLANVVVTICWRIIKNIWVKYLEINSVITETIWIQRRKILCNKFDKLLFKSNEHSARKSWIDWLHILESIKKKRKLFNIKSTVYKVVEAVKYRIGRINIKREWGQWSEVMSWNGQQ